MKSAYYKIKKYVDKNTKSFKNGTVLDNRYVSKVKSSAEIVCYSCNQVGHKSNKCIFDKTLGYVKCRKCQTFGHYQSKCNARDGITTNLLIDHCVTHNTNPKSFFNSKDHDPGYDRFTSQGFIINFDGTRTPIKILRDIRDTDSLQSLITTNCAMACAFRGNRVKPICLSIAKHPWILIIFTFLTMHCHCCNMDC